MVIFAPRFALVASRPNNPAASSAEIAALAACVRRSPAAGESGGFA
jgi:hypothetical protein